MAKTARIKNFQQLYANLTEAEKALVKKAYDLAKKAHQGQSRHSGEDYIIHPISIALNLYNKFGSVELVVASLLHDVIEDSDIIKMAGVYQQFGPKIGLLVDSVTKTELSYYKQKRKFKDKIEKVLWGGLKDVRALILKLADREHNLEDLGNLLPNNQVRISFETQAIYFPLKKILNYDKAKSVREIQANFDKFIKQKRIKTVAEFRRCLFKQAYRNLGSKTYDIIYKNSDQVIWTVSDQNFYKRMCQSEDFEKCARVVSLWSDGKRFRANFFFKEGVVLENQRPKISILKYKF